MGDFLRLSEQKLESHVPSRDMDELPVNDGQVLLSLAQRLSVLNIYRDHVLCLLVYIENSQCHIDRVLGDVGRQGRGEFPLRGDPHDDVCVFRIVEERLDVTWPRHFFVKLDGQLSPICYVFYKRTDILRLILQIAEPSERLVILLLKKVWGKILKFGRI